MLAPPVLCSWVTEPYLEGGTDWAAWEALGFASSWTLAKRFVVWTTRCLARLARSSRGLFKYFSRGLSDWRSYNFFRVSFL